LVICAWERAANSIQNSVNFLYSIGWWFYRFVFIAFFRLRIFNAERVPVKGAAILASNHASFFDPPLVGCSLPRELNYLARESLFRLPGLGWILREVNAVPVDRDGGGGAGLKAILNRLQAGGAIILFPEGTRTRDGKLQPARSGIGLAVVKSDAPVVPVRVFGTREAWGRGQRIPRPNPVAVKFGPLLRFAELRLEAKTCSKARLKEIYQQVADEIMAAIGRLEPYEDKQAFP